MKHNLRIITCLMIGTTIKESSVGEGKQRRPERLMTKVSDWDRQNQRALRFSGNISPIHSKISFKNHLWVLREWFPPKIKNKNGSTKLTGCIKNYSWFQAIIFRWNILKAINGFKNWTIYWLSCMFFWLIEQSEHAKAYLMKISNYHNHVSTINWFRI